MTTKTITLTSTPIQVTDGTNSGFVQALGGLGFLWADSDLSPDPTGNYNYNFELSINPPFKIWVWSHEPISVTVSTR